MTTNNSIPAYEGEDMLSFMLDRGFRLYGGPAESIKSITNVRDTAIIVTDRCIYLAEPSRDIGFSIQSIAQLRY